MVDAARQKHAMILKLVFVCFIFNALAAYSLRGIPLPWLGLALATVAAVVCFTKTRMGIPTFPGGSFLLIYFLYALLLNCYYYAGGQFETLVPPLNTTPYAVFISLRFPRSSLFPCYCFINCSVS